MFRANHQNVLQRLLTGNIRQTREDYIRAILDARQTGLSLITNDLLAVLQLLKSQRLLQLDGKDDK